jgi:hypothetical protein
LAKGLLGIHAAGEAPVHELAHIHPAVPHLVIVHEDVSGAEFPGQIALGEPGRFYGQPIAGQLLKEHIHWISVSDNLIQEFCRLIGFVVSHFPVR